MSTQMVTSYEERCALEWAREEQKRNFFLSLVPQVAAAMGEGWAAEELDKKGPPAITGVLLGPDPERIAVYLSLDIGYNAKRYPDGCRLYAISRYTHSGPELEYRHSPRSSRFEIGMDWKKTPAQIAQQIKNRLFPQYLPARAQIEAGTGRKFIKIYHGQEWRMDGVGVSQHEGCGDSFEFRESGLTAAQIIRLCAALTEGGK